jgi:hypothetical protein
MTLEWVGLGCRRRLSADRHPPARSREDRGAALVEAAIMIPVVMLVKFGTTRLCGASISLDDHAVFGLEPASTQLCP